MALFDRVREIAKALLQYGDMKTTSKDKIVKIIGYGIDELDVVDKVLTSLSVMERRKLKNDFITQIGAYPDDFMKYFFKNYHKDIINKAEAIEARTAFGSIHESVRNLRKTLEIAKVPENIDMLFSEEVIKISDIKISQGSFFMIIHASRMVAKYATYLLSVAMDVAYLKQSPANFKIEPYKLKYLKDHYKEFVSVVGESSTQSGKFNYLNDVKEIFKNPNIDFSFKAIGLVKGSVMSSAFNNVKKFTATDLFEAGLLIAIAPITFIGEVWIQYQHAVHQRNVFLKEWLEKRVALLTLEQSSTSDEVEKMKLKNYIEKYEELIKKQERLINEYEQK